MKTAPAPEDFDTRTYVDTHGVERWVDDDTAIRQDSVFRRALSGHKIDTADMAASHRSSVASRKSVDEAARAGKNRGVIHGLSKRADTRLVDHSRFNAFKGQS